MAPGVFAVPRVADWAEKLREHYVIVDQDERRRHDRRGLAEQGRRDGLEVAG